MNADTLAGGLGWFSIGLGLGEVVASRGLGRYLGMEDRAGVLRAFGVREIATGVGLLASRRRAPWMWGRVAGHFDLELLDLDLRTPAVCTNPRGDTGVQVDRSFVTNDLDRRAPLVVPLPVHAHDSTSTPCLPAEIESAKADPISRRSLKRPLARPVPMQVAGVTIPPRRPCSGRCRR